MKRQRQVSPRQQFLLSTGIAVVISLILFAYDAYKIHSLHYSYLIWNLFLAALPLVFALRIHASLGHKRWSDWEPIGWTLLWLLFLPNSFYMVSDYIHLRDVASERILFVAVMMTAFIFLAVILGFCSLYIVHRQLRRRLKALPAAAWVGGLLLLCSFAIYIGRDLRWNSWDVIINPGGLLFDVSDRFLRPDAYPSMLLTVASFFVLMVSLYGVLWSAVNVLRPLSPRER